MKTLNLLLCGLLAGCVSNPINYINQPINPVQTNKVEYYFSSKEMQVQFSFKIIAIVPPRERLDTYMDGDYKVVKAR